jgi:hypothetical protein
MGRIINRVHCGIERRWKDREREGTSVHPKIINYIKERERKVNNRARRDIVRFVLDTRLCLLRFLKKFYSFDSVKGLHL